VALVALGVSPPLIIRASSLSTFTDCQLRAAGHAFPHLFAEHGHDMAPRRANVGALVGSGVHGGAELALTELLLGGSPSPDDVLEDAGITAFRQRWAEDVGDQPVIMDDDTPSRNAAEGQVRRMVRTYRRDIVPRVRPVAVERRLEAEAVPGLVISGQSDLVALDAEKGGRTILHDSKTGRRRMSAWRHAPQLGAYTLLLRTRGHAVDGCQVDFIQRVKEQKPQPSVEQQPIGIVEAEKIADAVLKDFGAKALDFQRDGDPSRFLPNPSSLLCSAKYCRLWGSKACPATYQEIA
jgi:hypothetical protein